MVWYCEGCKKEVEVVAEITSQFFAKTDTEESIRDCLKDNQPTIQCDSCYGSVEWK